ncbi:MAG: Oligopeptide/dipeptide transporter, C-terminal region, partial [Solirubrobacteraceae bacterium]|nr:Oligopeptide/dipeptide transporter, C-terminal region [Solirubrobacteraceae bacterium]
MTDGRIVEQGTTERIFTAPEADYTRKLLANTPSIEVALGNVAAPAG